MSAWCRRGRRRSIWALSSRVKIWRRRYQRCIASFSVNSIRRYSMPNLAIVGYGKMGRLIDQLAPEYGFTVTSRVDVGREEPLAGADVAVEFSTPAAVLGNIRKVAVARVPIVVGTTGWVEHLAEARSIIA